MKLQVMMEGEAPEDLGSFQEAEKIETVADE
jgi:hypothetical protein